MRGGLLALLLFLSCLYLTFACRPQCQRERACRRNKCVYGSCNGYTDGTYSCSCSTAWTGRYCSLDLNECTTRNPCHHGRCHNTHGSYYCTCYTGYTGKNCDQDVNECRNRNPCDNGYCHNTFGGYRCSCVDGYYGNTCAQDVNECRTSNPCVHGSCHNTIGSYYCSCDTGYRGKNCNHDVNECWNRNTCDNGSCQNTFGGYHCSCVDGYYGNTCAQACNSTCATCSNGVSCNSCQLGYEQEEQYCIDINECTGTSNPCTHGNCINEKPGYTCECEEGYTGKNCDTDVDECLTTTRICNHGDCINTVGGYNCSCDQGWDGDACDSDINECALYHPCVHGTCGNTEGSYTCECDDGYEGKNCDIDVDECSTTPGICNHGNCSNTEGGYNCSCEQGWEGDTCDSDVDECRTQPCVHGTCNNTVGSFHCICDVSWQGALCDEDLNECEVDDSCIHGYCNNTVGGYRCQCVVGYTGRHCTSYCTPNCEVCESSHSVCDSCFDGYYLLPNASCADYDECNDIPCNNGVCSNYDGEYSCKCYTGWTGDQCDVDIDECYINTCKHVEHCVNSPGSYDCYCETGYYGTNCDLDVDECISEQPCKRGECTNIEGSYVCNCTGTGYQGQDCDQDVDECDNHPCMHGSCNNTIGSYSCSCDVGYTGENCDIDIDECETANPCVFGNCNNLNGSYECRCTTGWQGRNCSEDIKECEIRGWCKHGTCEERMGGYSCHCVDGYNGTQCEYDVNECKDPVCKNGSCINLKGSYRCDCDDGFYGTHNCTAYKRARLYPHGPGHDPHVINLHGSNVRQYHCVQLEETEKFDINCERFSRVCISPHGYITFGELDFSFANPRPLVDWKKQSVIAALHTYNQGTDKNQSDSNVWISKYSVFDDKRASREMFKRFKDELKELGYAHTTNFDSKLAVVVTYNQMRTYPYHKDKPKNTFQIALLSDTEIGATFAIFKYYDLRSRHDIPNTAGIRLRENLERIGIVEELPGAGTPKVFHLHTPHQQKGKFSVPANQPGEYFYLTNRPGDCNGTPWENPYKCQKWLYEYNKLESHQLGPMCFCNKRSSMKRGSDIFKPGRHNNCATTASFKVNKEQYKKRCCYKEDKTWLTRDRWYLFSHQLYSSTIIDSKGEIYLDKIKEHCCADDNSVHSCNLYKLAREKSVSSSNCRGMTEKEIAYANGDPHLMSGDGVQYSFQGVGEYVYAKSELFDIQARMTEYQSPTGEGTGASIITAVAMKAKNSNTLQIEAIGRNLLISSYPAHPTIHNLTQWFIEADDMDSFTYPGDIIMLFKMDGYLSVKFAVAETELQIQAGGYGDLSIALATTQGGPQLSTRGLVGLMNGDPSDDFMTPDNLTLPISSTEETIYWTFGQKWLVNQDNTSPSIFTYPPGMTAADFTTPPGYVPSFQLLTNETEERKAEIDEACGNNTACKYDLAATGIEDFALKRVEFEHHISDIQELSKFKQPRIRTPPQVHATVGEEVEFNVTVVGADNDTFEFLTSLPDDAEFIVSDKAGTVRWTPQNRDPVYGFTFGGFVSSGFPAFTVTVTVLLCDCSGHGDCTFNFLQNIKFENDSFALVHCDCHRGYTGIFCEEEYDACTDDPCIPGAQCTDESAEVEQATGRAFVCAGCPQGYQQLDGLCVEIDECDEAAQRNVTLCEPPEHSQCHNLVGGYECRCNTGYMMNTTTNTCVDKDECELYEHNCNQRCINTPGSYRCDCVQHYILQEDNWSCTAVQPSPTPCLAARLCSDYCVNDTHCGCKPGMTLSTFDHHTCMYNQECIHDDNDCGPNSVCRYSFPGYRCECKPGYQLNDDSRTCTACSAGYWGYECEDVCTCATATTLCLPSIGCVACPSGWTGGSCNEDIDECSSNSTLCGAHGYCTNVMGSYQCDCEEGYGWSVGDTDCIYINHCQLLVHSGQEPCLHGGICLDHLGGFSCNCTAGYEGDQCQTEIDECASDPCLNEGFCQDQLDGYACICSVGFTGQHCEVGV